MKKWIGWVLAFAMTVSVGAYGAYDLPLGKYDIPVTSAMIADVEAALDSLKGKPLKKEFTPISPEDYAKLLIYNVYFYEVCDMAKVRAGASIADAVTPAQENILAKIYKGDGQRPFMDIMLKKTGDHYVLQDYTMGSDELTQRYTALINTHANIASNRFVQCGEAKFIYGYTPGGEAVLYPAGESGQRLTNTWDPVSPDRLRYDIQVIGAYLQAGGKMMFEGMEHVPADFKIPDNIKKPVDKYVLPAKPATSSAPSSSESVSTATESGAAQGLYWIIAGGVLLAIAAVAGVMYKGRKK